MSVGRLLAWDVGLERLTVEPEAAAGFELFRSKAVRGSVGDRAPSRWRAVCGGALDEALDRHERARDSSCQHQWERVIAA